MSQMEHMQYTLRSYPVMGGSRYMEVGHNSSGGRVRLKWTFLGTVMPWKTWKLCWFNILSIPFSSELTNSDWPWSQPDSRLLLLHYRKYTLGTEVLQWACWVVVDPKYCHGSEVILPAEEGFTAVRAEQGQLVWPRIPDPSASGQDWVEAWQVVWECKL